MTTEGLNVLFSPEDISIRLDDSQILHLSFQSNPGPSNVTFITVESDCGDNCKTSQHRVSVENIENKVTFFIITMSRSMLLLMGGLLLLIILAFYYYFLLNINDAYDDLRLTTSHEINEW